MKKLILLTLFAGFLSNAYAQNEETRITPIEKNTANVFEQKEYRFTVSITPLISWISPDSKNLTNEGVRTGIGGGIMVEKNFSENVAFCGGLNVTQMGGKVGYDSLRPNSSAETFYKVNYTYKTRYVEVPLMIKLRTDEFGYSRVYFDAGFGLGFLWRGRADVGQNIFTNAQGGNDDRDINNGSDDFDRDHSVVGEDNLLFLRVPLLVGGGWEYAVSKNTVVFGGLRYSAGLHNIMRADLTKAFTNYFGLNVGVMF